MIAVTPWLEIFLSKKQSRHEVFLCRVFFCFDIFGVKLAYQFCFSRFKLFLEAKVVAFASI